MWLWAQINARFHMQVELFQTLALLRAANMMQAKPIDMSLHLRSMPDGSL
jgi:hypothetical protein